jgi:hypothetical protein
MSGHCRAGDSARVCMDYESGTFARTRIDDYLVWLRGLVFDRV